MGSLPPPRSGCRWRRRLWRSGRSWGGGMPSSGASLHRRRRRATASLGTSPRCPPPPSRQGVGHRRALPLQVRRWPGGKRPRPRKTSGGLADPGLRRGPADPIEGKGKPIAEVSFRVWVRPAKDESAEGRSFSPNTGPGGG